MAGCVLRIQGLIQDLPEWVKEKNESSKSVVLSVSDADECFLTQVNEALEYVQNNQARLIALKNNNPNLEWVLDFGVWLEIKLAQSFSFPPALVQAAGF